MKSNHYEVLAGIFIALGLHSAGYTGTLIVQGTIFLVAAVYHHTKEI